MYWPFGLFLRVLGYYLTDFGGPVMGGVTYAGSSQGSIGGHGL